MRKTLIAVAATLAVASITGCQHAPILAPDPVIIDRDATLDRVHIRDDSMEFYDDNRGGAAVRKTNASHVLWNEHYVADAKALEAKRLAAEKAAQEEREAQRQAKRMAELEALRQAKIKADKKSGHAKNKTVRDRSIYHRPSAPKPAVIKPQPKAQPKIQPVVPKVSTQSPVPVTQKPAPVSKVETPKTVSEKPVAGSSTTKQASVSKVENTAKPLTAN